MSTLSRREILQSGALFTVDNFLFRSACGMTVSFPAPLKGVEDPSLSQAIPKIDLSPRAHLLFDFNWRFIQGNAHDPEKDLEFGGGQDFINNFTKTGIFEFSQPKFDDSEWRSLNLPHDWAVELPFVDDSSLMLRGYKPLGRKYPDTSVGWYRRTFHVPMEDKGRRIYVNFDGAVQSSLVFCNGTFLGRSENGYSPFSFDLSDFLNYGEANTIAVRVDASFSEGWFYEGAGIYRHVWLTKLDPLHLAQWETVVRTEVQPQFATLNLGTTVENTGARDKTCSVHWQILDEMGKVVATSESPASEVTAGGNRSFNATAKISHPAIWSLERPNLYYAVVSVVESGGKIRDRDKAIFGVRTLTWDLEKGFLLNGEKTPIRGACNHQDHAGVGVALPDRLQAFRLEILKGMGCNAIRTAHNMPAPELIEASDRLGILVLCETRTMSSSSEAMENLSTMIRHYRNHPSIFLWSMGNEEEILQRSEAGPRVVHVMQQRAHQLDPTRLCTAGIDGNYDKPMGLALDVMGFNYHYGLIDKYRREHPGQPIIGTETSSAMHTRGIYSTDKLCNWVSSYDVVYPGANVEEAQAWWDFYSARPWLSGGFAWTGFDYRGEPTPYAWPSISSQFGIVDTCGFPKDTYFRYKAQWGTEPVLHLLPHWNWAGREGEEILVQVESNLDSVELFLNGYSLGSQKVVPPYHLEWKVRYTPGILEARGTKGGKIILTAGRRTSGDPAKIVLTADRNELFADGEDIAIIRVETVDKDGLSVPTANACVRFEVTGAGSLIGVGNGDPNCQQSDKKPERSLFNGLAVAILQASKRPGSLVIVATSDGLQPATLTLQAKQSKLRPFVV